jgi:hypothetical protein
LSPAKKPNAVEAPTKKKPKTRTVVAKTKKKSVPTPATTNEAGSEEETDSATKSENK